MHAPLPSLDVTVASRPRPHPGALAHVSVVPLPRRASAIHPMLWTDIILRSIKREGGPPPQSRGGVQPSYAHRRVDPQASSRSHRPDSVALTTPVKVHTPCVASVRVDAEAIWRLRLVEVARSVVRGLFNLVPRT